MQPQLTGQSILVPRTEETDQTANSLRLHVKQTNERFEGLQARHETEREGLEDEITRQCEALQAAHLVRRSMFDQLMSLAGHGLGGVLMVSAQDISIDTLDKELALLQQINRVRHENLTARQEAEVRAFRAEVDPEYTNLIELLLEWAGYQGNDLDTRYVLLRTASTAEHHILDPIQLDDNGEPMASPSNPIQDLFSQVFGERHHGRQPGSAGL